MMKKGKSRRRTFPTERQISKEEDTSPSSTSQMLTNTTTTSAFVSTSDEETISSSTRLCDERVPSPPQPLPTVKQKAVVDSPPDDVKAFFGHPLTLATSAMNGQEVDTNANAAALLHEYIHLSDIDREELKVGDKFTGYLNIISEQRGDPQLSRTGLEKCSPAAADSHTLDSGIVHQDGVDVYEEELMEDASQTGDAIVMREAYDSLFQEEFQLNLMVGHSYSSKIGVNNRDVNSFGTKAMNRTAQLSEKSSEEAPRKTQTLKKSQVSTFHKQTPDGTNKRTTRKPRAKPDVVSSTTNGPIKHDNRRELPRPLDRLATKKYEDSREESVETSGSFRHQEIEMCIVSSEFDYGTAVDVFEVGMVPTSLSNMVTSAPAALITEPTLEKQTFPTPASAGPTMSVGSVALQQEGSHNQSVMTLAPLPVVTVVNTIPSSAPNHVVSASQLPNTTLVSPSTAITVTSPAAALPSSNIIIANPPSVVAESSLKENYLKKALSEKIRSRQVIEESLSSIPAQNTQFLSEDVTSMGIEVKFSSLLAVKQEDPYLESYDQEFSYGAEFSHALPNCSTLPITSFQHIAQNVTPVTMTQCGDILPHGEVNDNVLHGITQTPVHYIHNDSVNSPHLNQHHPHHHHHIPAQQQQDLNNSHIVEDANTVQSFHVLQPLQPIASNTQVTSTVSNNINGGDNCYYNYIYQREAGSQLLDRDKMMVIERCLHHQYPYNNGYNNNYFNTDRNYNMRSPDSGYQEPSVSPNTNNSTIGHTLKDVGAHGNTEGPKEKTKRRKNTGAGAGGNPLLSKFSCSSSEKGAPKSAMIRKLENNPTGYSYFLDAPISTTQRRDEDRVTYLNKSQYYSLCMEFDRTRRTLKNSVVKSVIILTFRDEKPMEEEKKAWEFWHGRQHSYKQRILDIDTKNCEDVLPQNIEEVSFNAVAVKWNPMEGPVKVNIAVHCLSTDFSNQKGVKGIPLHIQIDTYEQSSRENRLVHRGYCQIKAFCDKGAERKTRDEERRKTVRSKSDDSSNGSGSVSSKSRRKTDESFHDPCEKSEFYSMVDVTSAPVFFNPLHESTEFIHKSISLGVVPSQDEEISSVPSSLELPDSCDDYYINSPAKRPRKDSCSYTKDQHKVLLYVRERHETVYTALMLEVPTMLGLLKSIEQKYAIAPNNVKNLYKKSRKGILVKIDDNIVRHYSHEATFIIETTLLNEAGDYEITLIEIDALES